MKDYQQKIHNRRSIRLKNYDYSSDGTYFVTICCQGKKCRFGKVIDEKIVLNENGKIAYEEWLSLPERFNNLVLDYFQIMPNHIHGILVLEGKNFEVEREYMQRHIEISKEKHIKTNDTVVGATLAVALDETLAVALDETLAVARNAQTLERAVVLCERATARVAPTKVTNNENEIAKIDVTKVSLNKKETATIGEIVGAYKSLVVNKCLKNYEKRNEIMGKFWQRNYFEHVIINNESYANIAEYIVKNTERWQNDEYYCEF